MTVMKAILVVCAFLLVASVRLASGFTVGGTTSCTSDSSASLVSKVIERTTTSTSRPSTLLRLFDSEQEQSGIVGDGGDDVTFDSSELYKSLNKRKRAIKSGVGKVLPQALFCFGYLSIIPLCCCCELRCVYHVSSV